MASCRASSPLTRGKQAASATSGGGLPTHPRSRGENSSSSTPTARWRGSSPLTRGKPPRPRGPRTPVGSSPLTRGKLQVVADIRTVVGLIPACAGKTAGSFPEWSPFGAHPHSCGENVSHACIDGCPPGSSPLTRGKLPAYHRPGRVHGLIPTHVGNMQRLGKNRPHSRLIPAHAGKTLHDPAHRSASKAHPRSRRENPKIVVFDNLMDGSSPLTQGKP